MRTFRPEVATPPRAQLDRADRRSRERMLDLDLVGLELRADAADRDVAAAVDDEPRVAAEPVRDRVGAQPLAGARRCRASRPSGRMITPASSSTSISRQREPGSGRAGRRVGRAGERLEQRRRLGTVERVA